MALPFIYLVNLLKLNPALDTAERCDNDPLSEALANCVWVKKVTSHRGTKESSGLVHFYVITDYSVICEFCELYIKLSEYFPRK